MSNRLVKTTYVLYTPAVKEVVGVPARCVTTEYDAPGASNPFAQQSKPAFNGEYWVSGTPEVASDPNYGAGWR